MKWSPWKTIHRTGKDRGMWCWLTEHLYPHQWILFRHDQIFTYGNWLSSRCAQLWMNSLPSVLGSLSESAPLPAYQGVSMFAGQRLVHNLWGWVYLGAKSIKKFQMNISFRIQFSATTRIHEKSCNWRPQPCFCNQYRAQETENLVRKSNRQGFMTWMQPTMYKPFFPNFSWEPFTILFVVSQNSELSALRRDKQS